MDNTEEINKHARELLEFFGKLNTLSVEEKWDSFWKDIVCNPDGSLNIEQVKKELADLSMMINHCNQIYYEISGGVISKPQTYPQYVIDRHYDELQEEYDRGYQDALQEHDIKVEDE